MEPITPQEQISLSKQMFIAVKQAKNKLEKIERSKNEPIAIIGIGCQFPGDANTPEKFWQLLCSGQDAVREIDRWDIDSYYDPNPDTPGKMYIRHAALVSQVDRFDADFFGISPREANSLDPQQRFLLEVTWEALERAGINPHQLENTQTGVFLGIGQNDYFYLNINELNNISPHDGTGNGFCFAAGRLSYVLGLQGPSLAIDTACSASLVAVHQACQSLRQGESNLAIAGGVQLILSPQVTTALSRLKALSPDGRCKTFDAAADGYGRGEGCGIVVLKRLSDALKDGDKIWAVIRGSAVNHDGASSGLTVPNKLAQEKLIQQALKVAKLEPSQVGYVEAHGTGTSLGDPVEVKALATVFGQGHNQENPLLIGSVKTNIGHLEAAAGIAGLIKVVLQLQHQKIVPHLNFINPNPYIDWENIPLKVPTQRLPWPSSEGKRVAGVSSFAISGTNAHVLLEEAPVHVKSQSSQERPVHLLTLSAKTEKALEELIERYHNHLEIHQQEALADICYTANTGRAHFNHRLAIIASNQQELTEKLLGYKKGSEVVGLFSGSFPSSTTSPNVAFLFTGQGSQYINMGQKLYNSSPVFRQALDQCDELLRGELEHSLLSVLYPQEENNSSLLDQTAYTQPALFAIEYALAQLWQSWGIKPDVVMGHSVGEYVAATVAGVFSLEDGLKLIATRGRLMQQLPTGGEMVSVMASESRVRPFITPYAGQVAVAAINGPESVVISGASEAIVAMIQSLESEGIKNKRLQVSHAFHSPLMSPILAEFEALAKQLTINQPQIPLISNTTGTRADYSITDAQYWVNHLRQPVRFAQGMETLRELGYKVFLEIGPQPILLGMGRQCLSAVEGVWLPSIRSGVNEWQSMLSSLGQLYTQGVKVDWSGFDQDYRPQKVLLPTYPFQRQSYWKETGANIQPNTSSVAVETTSTQILDWLAQGETQKLAQQLEKTGNLDQGEVDLLPKLLELLVKEHKQQLALASIKDWLYQIEWKTKARLAQRSTPDYLLTPVEIEAQLMPTLQDLVATTDLDIFSKILPKLEALSIDYVVQSFREMCWSEQVGEHFYIDAAANSLGIDPNYRRLFNRLVQMLAEVGIVQETQQQQWQMLQVLEKIDTKERNQAIQNQHPEVVLELNLLERCASQLSKVLRGEQDPLKLLFPGGDATDVTYIYQDAPAAKVINAMVQKAVAKAIEKLPPSRGIRFLEIGAGTGSTTGYILPHLPPLQTEYVFTDLGTSFVSKAKEKFRDYPFVRYQTLDIEVDPVAQGFESHQYDVIIAANVLHATTSIKETLSHVRKLLAPGGQLVLLEATTRQRWVDLWIGMLEGWWRFTDTELRSDHPLLSKEQWQQMLSETGFAEVVTLPETDGLPEVMTMQTVIIAQADRTTVESPSSGKGWLLFGDKQGVAQKLATQLRSVGEACTLVWPGEKYQQIAPEEFTINPNQIADYSRLLAKVTANQQTSIEILHLWSLDTPVIEQLSVETLLTFSKKASGTVLFLVQALLKAGCTSQSRLWLVTCDAEPVQGIKSSISGLAQSPVWGMGRVISLEYPDLWGGMVDLDPQNLSTDESVANLLAEIWDGDGEDHVAFRDEQRYVTRLMPSDQLESVGIKVHGDATYLITAGLDYFGLKLGQWMVDRGARNLVMITPQGFPLPAQWTDIPPQSEEGKKIETIQSLEKKGAKVIVFSADITDQAQMSDILEQINQLEKPLKGIIHGASVGGECSIEKMEPQLLEFVLGLKIVGTWILHQLTKNIELDFFVCCSSVGSIWGSQDQVHDHAINHFLDTFSYYRRYLGLPGLTINWGNIGAEAMGVAPSYVESLERIGLEELQLEQALSAFEVLLNSNAVQTLIARVNWGIFKQVYQGQKSRQFLVEIEIKSEEFQELLSAEQPEILKQLQIAPESERMGLLIAYIQDEVSKLLGLQGSKRPSIEQGFFEIGMDSLMAIELKNNLEANLLVPLPDTLTFEFSNIVSLGEYIAKKILDLEIVAHDQLKTKNNEEKDKGKYQEVSANLKELSEQEIEDLINQELEDLGAI
ncbi:MAG: acyltransferase domain-containing protein [Moorea sp. SIOASIH]|uniref:type I polyketide synthase n=1 Tax=Moorena sp. SIOASIH TaxID=2607817 RepID=UPI0013BD3C21|nr:type I polyketide synthase [Moorena sp. SIOASIH]NEO42201.1 acyltransferase domain-containing protein [Moorena sp. SIOASIH]